MADVKVPRRPLHAGGSRNEEARAEGGEHELGVTDTEHRDVNETREAQEIQGKGDGAEEQAGEQAGGLAGSGTQGESGDGEATPTMYIRVPNPEGGFFFFDTETQELYEGDGEPPPGQVMKEPSLDSPLRLPPRGAGFSEL